MNCEERNGPDDRSDSSPTHGAAPDTEDAASTPSPLAHIDALAVATLSSEALARYQAYKEVLLAREQDEAAILSTLTLFVRDLSESR
ncbi:hypothetical protein [Steroidobacter agaridevorans]|uniref:hypothetical protein n=1 Tax=Steroidobacter agaridevorans TaxID=2695856 RepID=UPI00137B22D6|nr:hypothetical protein [Steroidobacter agaridevorans]